MFLVFFFFDFKILSFFSICFLERERKVMGFGGRQDLEGVGGGETVT